MRTLISSIIACCYLAAISLAFAGPVEDKWKLWTGGTKLRGANLHPCKIFSSGKCHDVITRQDIAALRDLGANLINASYPGVFSEEPPYKVEINALKNLNDLVGWAEEMGIYVVIHFRTGPGRNEAAIHLTENANFDVWTNRGAHSAWIKMWRFIAERFRKRSVVLGYNLMVEPHVNTLIDPDGELDPLVVQARTKGTLKDWNAFTSEMTAAIRKVDPKTPIIVNSLNWADAAWFPALTPTGDSRTIYSLHAYNPNAYTNQDAGNCSISYPSMVLDSNKRITFNRSWLEEYFRPALDFAKKHHVPIYVGEFGAFRWVPGATNFLRDETDLFEQYGWNYSVYVWRGDDLYFDGFNLEYGTDSNNHISDSNNPLLRLFHNRWAKNSNFPTKKK